MCGTKCGSALHPIGSVLQRFPARPDPALTGKGSRQDPPKSTSGARQRHFLGCPAGGSPPPGESG
eukprot:2680115-Alexandrium_andersonii.AAC.1